MGGESTIPWLDRARAAPSGLQCGRGTVLVIVGGRDRLVHRRLAPLAQPTVGADGAADGPISPSAGKRQ